MPCLTIQKSSRPVYVTADRPGDYLPLFLKTAAIPGLVRHWYFETPGMDGPKDRPRK